MASLFYSTSSIMKNATQLLLFSLLALSVVLRASAKPSFADEQFNIVDSSNGCVHINVCVHV